MKSIELNNKKEEIALLKCDKNLALKVMPTLTGYLLSNNAVYIKFSADNAFAKDAPVALMVNAPASQAGPSQASEFKSWLERSSAYFLTKNMGADYD